jgi:hypothetical protein
MNYLLLPPGLDRRIAYSNYLDNRRRERRRNNIHTSPINTNIYLHISPIRRQNINRIDFSYESLFQLQDVKVGLISKNILDKTQVKINRNNDFCVICQEDIKKDIIIREINCKHSFHINCIDNWLVENKKCPMCKYEI